MAQMRAMRPTAQRSFTWVNMYPIGALYFSQSSTADVLIDRRLVPKQLSSSTVGVPHNRLSRSTGLSSTHTIVCVFFFCEEYQLPNNFLTAERSGSIQKTAVSVDPSLWDQNAHSALIFPTPRQSQCNFIELSIFCRCSLILPVTLPDLLIQLRITCLGPAWIRSGCARYTHSCTIKKIGWTFRP